LAKAESVCLVMTRRIDAAMGRPAANQRYSSGTGTGTTKRRTETPWHPLSQADSLSRAWCSSSFLSGPSNCKCDAVLTCDDSCDLQRCSLDVYSYLPLIRLVRGNAGFNVSFEAIVTVCGVQTYKDKYTRTSIQGQAPVHQLQSFDHRLSTRVSRIRRLPKTMHVQPQESKSQARQYHNPFRKCHRDNARLAKTASRPARKELFVIGSQPISPPEGKEKRKRPPDKRLHNAQGLV
jgi:hypothetical protein